MAAHATGNLIADLAPLDEAAERAGCALVCSHQSSDELHRDMIQRYFAQRGRWRPLGLATGVAALAALLIFF